LNIDEKIPKAITKTPIILSVFENLKKGLFALLLKAKLTISKITPITINSIIFLKINLFGDYTMNYVGSYTVLRKNLKF